MNKESTIASILKKHSRNKDCTYNARAWEFFRLEAIRDKVWTQDLTAEWYADASNMSKQWANNVLDTPTNVLAARAYGYSFYRAHATQKTGWGTLNIDPTAKELWESFEE